MLIQVRSIANSWKDARTWTSLLGVLALWVMARVIVPAPSGAALPGLWLPSCPLQSLAGIPCPFCGITTGSSWLVRGNLHEAWRNNILSPMLMIGSLVYGGYVLFFRLAAGRSLVVDLEPRMRRTLWIVSGAAVMTSWVFNLLKAA